PRRPDEPSLKLSHALALGVLHGPAELLPVSSSAHTTLVPWLLGWSYPDLDAELRKAFEVALHAGTAAALLIGLRDEGADAARGFRRPDANALSRHVALPVIVGPTALKGARLARRGLPGGVTRAFAAGIGAAFASTLVSVRLIRAVERDRPLAPYAAYRLVLA